MWKQINYRESILLEAAGIRINGVIQISFKLCTVKKKLYTFIAKIRLRGEKKLNESKNSINEREKFKW